MNKFNKGDKVRFESNESYYAFGNGTVGEVYAVDGEINKALGIIKHHYPSYDFIYVKVFPENLVPKGDVYFQLYPDGTYILLMSTKHLKLVKEIENA